MRKNEQLNKRWKNTKSQQVEHFDFLRVESSLRTCWRFEIEKTGKKTKPTSQKLSIFEAKNRRIQKKSRKKTESRKVKRNKKNQKNEKSESSQAKRFMFEKSNTFWRFARSLTLKVKKTQSRKNEKSKSVDFLRTKITRKHRMGPGRILFDFWLFAKSFAIFTLCDYRREERLEIPSSFSLLRPSPPELVRCKGFFG